MLASLRWRAVVLLAVVLSLASGSCAHGERSADESPAGVAAPVASSPGDAPEASVPETYPTDDATDDAPDEGAPANLSLIHI